MSKSHGKVVKDGYQRIIEMSENKNFLRERLGFENYSLEEFMTEATRCRQVNGFHTPLSINGENGEEMLGKLMLVVSEVSEMAEAVRSEDNDNFAEEAADVFIRMFDICNTLGLDMEYEIMKKMIKNRGRKHLHGRSCKL